MVDNEPDLGEIFDKNSLFISGGGGGVAYGNGVVAFGNGVVAFGRDVVFGRRDVACNVSTIPVVISIPVIPTKSVVPTISSSLFIINIP